ncbi:MAG: ABC transporter permease [Gemmatimonadaceae bacterium]|nr:ABC transporter permease [Gemmatimonadaceae bacterium]
MRILDQLQENVGIALDSIRASKLRAGLTILGVVIGVSSVMSMATIVSGIQTQIVQTIEQAGPTTFYVFKAYNGTPVNPDAIPAWIRIRPDLQMREADRIALVPEVAYAGLWGIIQGRLEYGEVRTQPNRIYGADDHFTDIIGGELVLGRWFSRSELASGASVVVIPEDLAREMFGRRSPLGRTIKVGGRPAEVIGLYQPASNVFQPPGVETSAIVPFKMVDQQFTLDKANGVFLAVKGRGGIPVADAQEAVMVVLREMRGLRPADKNNFDFVTQDQILQIFNRLTGAFFLVMVSLSSVGLLVGGIGVMAIMMVSVTSRTREIGVRKALGATRRDIMLQFLFEAATLTGIGGLIGVVTGLVVGRLAALALNVDAPTPVGITAIAVMVSVGIGLVFGLIPARKAARLDPVEALRYE